MSPVRLPSTVLDICRSLRHRRALSSRHPARGDHQVAQDHELKLPKIGSLVIVLSASALLQVSFFIIVSSSNEYAQHLGGTSTFSGLVIGIPTVFSGLALLPLMKVDQGRYKRPLHFACGSAMIGSILYSLAYKANFLYLILIGRIVSGFGFTFWMYSKRYCSDPRIVGIRRRTTLAGWLVLGQGAGFSIGPFIGGLLYRVGFSNSVFNGYTSPTWIMAIIWAVFWAVAAVVYEDVPITPSAPSAIELAPVLTNLQPGVGVSGSADLQQDTGPSVKQEEEITVVFAPTTELETIPLQTEEPRVRMSLPQWGVTATMCWFAMTCFFILGAWEANIPVFTAMHSALSPFQFSPYAAGNLIALGGICTIPFLLLNVFFARRVQDRHTLAIGTSLGLVGLIITIAIFSTRKVNYGSLFVCWFLIALGFNLASTVTLSLLSKQLPGDWNAKISLAIQYSNYTGRVTGAVWGGSGVTVGMLNYVGLQIAVVGIGAVMFLTLWKNLKAKTG
ncbi:MFS general substrate transporter [Sparassis latifolia]|uniref:MFS general substrate transporter n=1 Tax=Sparassis crispa TaxID=139825 RepID=A0A401GVJ7_9APHY|nr:hypothetical protein SCP_0803060 [Sparassis crispa]GBE85784.1 hypothetical protein SCP_0803060 [Sparassis crispa]